MHYKRNDIMNMQSTMTAGFLTVTESAQELGIARQNVWAQIKGGAIKAMRVGEVYIIPQNEIRKFRQKSIHSLESRLAVLKAKEKGAQ